MDPKQRIETRCVQAGWQPKNGDPRVLPVLLLHVLANALTVPIAARVFGALVGAADAPEAPRTDLRFDEGTPLR